MKYQELTPLQVVQAEKEIQNIKKEVTRIEYSVEMGKMLTELQKDDKWKKIAYSWIESELASNNLEKTGEITQFHIRPWSTVFNVPVKNGLLYFKACAPVLRHEVPLSDFLFKHNVECSPEILSINAEKGWLLLYNGLTTQQYQRLKGFLPQFETMCQELRSCSIPESLHHDDFHDNNIFVKKDRYTFADWGESCIYNSVHTH